MMKNSGVDTTTNLEGTGIPPGQTTAEVWVVDPNRGNRSHFNRNMAALGFELHEELLAHAATQGPSAHDVYKGRMLTYTRG